MRKSIQKSLALIVGIALSWLVPTSGCYHDRITYSPARYTADNPDIDKEWKIILYMAGDNNLEYFIEHNLYQIMEAFSENPTLENRFWVLAYVCTNRPGEGKIARRLVVHGDYISEVGLDEQVDSGSPEALEAALMWAHDYNAAHTMLVLWDHGDGQLNRTTLQNGVSGRGICYDDTTEHYLTDRNLYEVLERYCAARQGKKLDILACDACLMAALEVAATVRPWAHYFVASQQTIPAQGYNYYGIFSRLAQLKNVSANQFARTIVAAYDDLYRKGNTKYTLSAVVLDERFDELVMRHNTISQLLLELIDQQVTDRCATVIAYARNASLYFTDRSYRDLGCFYQYLWDGIDEMRLSTPPAQAIKQKLRHELLLAQQALRKAVVVQTAGVAARQSSGLHFYFPANAIHQSYADLVWTKANPAWNTFLMRFV
jgi:hypothetical protein